MCVVNAINNNIAITLLNIIIKTKAVYNFIKLYRRLVEIISNH
jgi:hypothetical protein